MNFSIHDEKIHLYDETEYPLTDNQKYYLKTFSNIAEVEISGSGTREHTGDRHIFTSEPQTLKYVTHKIHKNGENDVLIILQKNDKIELLTYYELVAGTETIRAWNSVTNISDKRITLEYISSFYKMDMIGYNHYSTAELIIPHNSWYFEAQWKRSKLIDLGIVSSNELKTFKKYCVSNTGAWPSKNYLPMGMLKDSIEERCYMWQIEANGSWSYEIGDMIKNVTLNLSGPTFQENGWAKHLESGESFESVKAAITLGKDEFECIENITRYRRKICKRTFDWKDNPVIFNEYMLASWNCPSHETATALAPTAKKIGADYFVIDCGWHDEILNPFYYVGKWEESKTKYPNGLKNTLKYLESLGLKTGLWMEPEVVGALGDAKKMWDDDCYFQRFGKPLVISNRYQLDFRNKKVTDFLEEKISYLVNEYNIGYLKLDYNIEPGVGTDLDSDSFGDGLLEHNRKYHEFISKIGQKHPNLIIEGCASGGNRLDYLTMENVNLVSTSDQTDYLTYPYIVSNLLTAVLPEQAGIWCYPKLENLGSDEISFEDININLMNSMIGRVHMASKLYLFSEDKQSFMQKGIEFYHSLDSFKQNAVPFYPKGFSSFDDESLAFGLKNDGVAYLWVYNLKNDADVNIDLKGANKVELAFPLEAVKTSFEFENEKLTYHPTQIATARLFKIIYE